MQRLYRIFPRNPMLLNLLTSGNKYQKFARQNNCNLTEANGYWHLYQDGKLVARDRHPWDAVQILTLRRAL